MLLSIGMMVKNEEKYLDKCLASLQPILENIESELIIVDTGSEDKTVEIAKKYTNKIYFHKWNNNFSGMRNKVLEYCTGEWFLCFDGDEVLEDCDDIIEFFKDGSYLRFNSATIFAKNLVDENNLNKTSSFDSLRLFKNEDGFKYIGSVHNQPTWKEPVKRLNSSLLHYGYIATDKELMERKFKRTSELLIKELDKNPKNLYYRFQLSVTYGMHGDYKEALEEAENSYNLLIESNEERVDYRYIYCNYVKMLMIADKYLEVEKIALEGIDLTNEKTVDKIDLYFNLAKAQYKLKKTKDSIINYNKYLEYLNLYNSNEIISDASIINYHIKDIDAAYIDLFNLYAEDKNYEKLEEILYKIENENIIPILYKQVILVFNELKKYDQILRYFEDRVQGLGEKQIKRFFSTLENIKNNLSIREKESIDNLFENIDNNYGKLIKARRVFKESNLIIKGLESIEEAIINEEADNYYGDLIYFKLKKKEDVNYLLKSSYQRSINEYLVYLYEKNEDFTFLLIEYIKNENKQESFYTIKLKRIFLRFLILTDKLSKDDYKFASELYIDLSMKYVQYIYSQYVIENELIKDCKNEEDAFAIYIYKAYKNKEDKKIALRYLSKALDIYNDMHKLIGLLIEEFSEKTNEEKELDILKEKFINNIEILIANNNLIEAEELIAEYESILGSDLSILSLKSKIKTVGILM